MALPTQQLMQRHAQTRWHRGSGMASPARLPQRMTRVDVLPTMRALSSALDRRSAARRAQPCSSHAQAMQGPATHFVRSPITTAPANPPAICVSLFAATKTKPFAVVTMVAAMEPAPEFGLARTTQSTLALRAASRLAFAGLENRQYE